MQNTNHHIPLIALQPYTMEPFTAAKIIHSITNFYKRPIYINMVTGLSENDLGEIENNLSKEQRYARLKNMFMS